MLRDRAAWWIFAGTTLHALLDTTYQINERLSYGRRINGWQVLFDELVASWAAGLLYYLLLPVLRRHRFTVHRWRQVLPVQAVLLLGYSAVHTGLMWLGRTPLYPLFGWGQYNYGALPERALMEFSADLIGYVSVLAVLHAVWLYQETREQQLENLLLQLQPHFIFNSLNAISTVVYEDPRRADLMITQLSELLRRTLKATAATVSLAEELETLELYLDMMQTRFEDQLTVELDIGPEARGARVPAFLLQPLVENVIKHGADPVTGQRFVRVEARQREGRLYLAVSDQGPGSSGREDGVGLSNTRRRLEQIYGGAHHFSAGNSADGGFLCRIDLPCAS
ncbi:MAG: histidine kinase [Acidobacteria bacterium]|nr:histidine kinase [Acidobacteriota bacterium]